MIRLALLLFAVSFPVSAEIIFYDFNDPNIEQRFNQLIEDMRCPKCQNNNLADSNAPLSVDLKQIIYDKLHQGASDQEIINFLKQRYGDFIYYKPPINASTWFIWFGPFVVLFIAGVIIVGFFNRKKAQSLEGEQVVHLATADDWQREAREIDR